MTSTSERRGPLWRDRNLLVIYGVTLMAVLGVASITPAFPSMRRALAVSPQQIGLLITVFTVPGVLLTPLLGIVADRFGRKRVLVPALLTFAAAGAGCAAADSFHTLLLLRFLQGIGAASLGSLNVTLVGDLFAPSERSAAMGYNSAVLSLGTATYPAVGGAMAMLGWRFPFLLPLAAVPVALLVLTVLDTPQVETTQHLRGYLRSVLRGVSDRRVLTLFLASTATFIILYGSYLTYFPFLMSHRFASSARDIGLAMSAGSLATAVTSSQLGRLTRVASERTLMLGAFVLYAVSLASLPLVHDRWLILLPIAVFGVAQGANIPSIITLLTRLAPADNRAAFMSLNGMVLRLGQTLGPLVMGVAFAAGGVAATFHAGAAVAVVMIPLLALALRPS